MSKNALSYFDIPSGSDGQVKGKCTLCKSTIAGNTKTTSNFVTHLKRKHRDEYLSLKDQIQSSPVKTGQTSMNRFVATSSKYSASDPRQCHITNALINFIAGDLMPLSVVNSENVRKLLNSLDSKYQVPDRKTLTQKILHQKSVEVQANLKQHLRRAESVALTINLWSNRQMRGFLGITGHYMLDWTLKTVMISYKRFKGSHTAENISQEVEECLACFEIGQEISCIITDNASNMTKAFDFSLPGFSEEQSECASDSEDDDCEKEDYIDTKPEIEVDVGINCKKHRRCFAHTLQLVVKDGLKEISHSLKNVLAKAATVVNFSRRSLLAAEILEGEKRLQVANVTRWNSQLHMIRSVLEVPEEKLNLLDTVKITAYERKLLLELCQILKPFEEATVMVQTDTNVSASLAVPITIGLKHTISQLSVTYNSKMTMALKTSLEKRMCIYENDDLFEIAAVLDPRFKMKWCEPDKVCSLTKTLTQEASKWMNTDKHDSDIQPEKVMKLELEDNSSLFSFMTPTKKRHISGHDSLVPEINSYLSEDTCRHY